MPFNAKLLLVIRKTKVKQLLTTPVNSNKKPPVATGGNAIQFEKFISVQVAMLAYCYYPGLQAAVVAVFLQADRLLFPGYY